MKKKSKMFFGALLVTGAAAAPSLRTTSEARASEIDAPMPNTWERTCAVLAGGGTVPNRDTIARAGGPNFSQVYALGYTTRDSGGDLAPDFLVYQYSGAGNYTECGAWSPIDDGRGWAVAIAGAPDTPNHWAVNAHEELHKYFADTNEYSPPKSGLCAYGQIAVGPNDDIWATSCDGPGTDYGGYQARDVYEGSGCGGNDANCTWTQREMFDGTAFGPASAIDIAFDPTPGGVAWIIASPYPPDVRVWVPAGGVFWRVSMEGLPANSSITQISVTGPSACVAMLGECSSLNGARPRQYPVQGWNQSIACVMTVVDEVLGGSIYCQNPTTGVWFPFAAEGWGNDPITNSPANAFESGMLQFTMNNLRGGYSSPSFYTDWTGALWVLNGLE